MSLKTSVRNAIDSAFSAAGDLAKKVTFYKKSNTTYDWSTGQYSSSESSISIKAIVTDTSDSSGDESISPTKTVIIRLNEVGEDISLYSTLLIDGLEHRISSLEKYEGIAILKVKAG